MPANKQNRVTRIEIYKPPQDPTREGEAEFRPKERELFARGLRALNETGVPYLVAGAFATHAYTGIWRNTKDLDVFLQAAYLKAALDALSAAGFKTSVTAPHWLAKAEWGADFIDLIFGIGHGRLAITEDWFEGSQSFEIAGICAPLIPLEELIAAKAYVCDRYRFDGSDIVHLILGAKGRIDWSRAIKRLGNHQEILLWHLILFDFVDPGHADYLPQDLMRQLFEQVQARWSNPGDSKAFRGMLLDPLSFRVDVEAWGYEDQRDLTPLVDEQGKLIRG